MNDQLVSSGHGSHIHSEKKSCGKARKVQ